MTAEKGPPKSQLDEETKAALRSLALSDAICPDCRDPLMLVCCGLMFEANPFGGSGYVICVTCAGQPLH